MDKDIIFDLGGKSAGYDYTVLDCMGGKVSEGRLAADFTRIAVPVNGRVELVRA